MGSNFDDAAALPIAYGTAHRMLFTRGKIRKGEKILILGASGGVGVGVACLQFAKMAGLEVFVCTSTEEKGRKLKELGADHVVNYVQNPDFAKAVWTASGKKGVDVAVNFTGGDTWIPTQRCMAVGGRILTCGSTAAISVRWTCASSGIGKWTLSGRAPTCPATSKPASTILETYENCHRLLPGAAETALARINALSERMRTQPGYCFHYVGTEADDPSCVTSVTAWATAADCSAWEARLAASPLPKVERLYNSAERFSVNMDEGPAESTPC